jgi:hypothetical protein
LQHDAPKTFRDYGSGPFQSNAGPACVTAALFGAMPVAVLGVVGTIAIALLWMKLFPALREVEKLE